MNTITISWAWVKKVAREVASVAGVVVSIGNELHLPSTTRAVLLAGSLWIQKVQHEIDAAAAAQKSSTNPTTPGGPS